MKGNPNQPKHCKWVKISTSSTCVLFIKYSTLFPTWGLMCLFITLRACVTGRKPLVPLSQYFLLLVRFTSIWYRMDCECLLLLLLILLNVSVHITLLVWSDMVQGTFLHPFMWKGQICNIMNVKRNVRTIYMSHSVLNYNLVNFFIRVCGS